MTVPAGGPYVVLIGGPMTVDDGSSFDSRQVVIGDPTSEVTRRALAMSRLWWSTTESVVFPILESAGPEACAMVLGVRSVVEILPDGSIKRSLLSKLLRGGVGKASTWWAGPGESLPPEYEEVARNPMPDGTGYSTSGVQRAKPGSRWLYVGVNSLRPEEVIAALGPTVVVDTDGLAVIDEYYFSQQFKELDKRLHSPECVLVLPHTAGIEAFLNRYLEWIEAGRPPDPYDERPYVEFDPDAPDSGQNPLGITTAAAVSAKFGVTGLIRGTEWIDPADLEAARALLEVRYDLKIGIWDLVGNPTLRQTLLDASPVQPAPAEPTPVPEGALRRAEAQIEAGRRKMMNQEEQLAQMALDLSPLLALGWRLGVGHQHRTFRLPLVSVPRVVTDDPPEMDDFAQPEGVTSLLHIDLLAAPHRANVSAYSCMFGVIDVGAYVEHHRSALEAIAASAPCSLGEGRPSLWLAEPGLGPDAHWLARAQMLAVMTPKWIEVFAELAEECLRARAALGHPLQ